MKKEELIKLREELLKTIYTPVSFQSTCNDTMQVIPFDEYRKTKEEIMDEYDPCISEENAVNYFETCVETIMKNAMLQGIEFDRIVIDVEINHFVNNNLVNKIDDNCYMPIESYNRKDILDDYVKITFNFTFGDSLDAEKYLNGSKDPSCKEFLVHYGRFVSFVISHGFDINDKTFDESLQRRLSGNNSTINIEFVKENKRNR